MRGLFCLRFGQFLFFVVGFFFVCFFDLQKLEDLWNFFFLRVLPCQLSQTPFPIVPLASN